MQHFGRNLLYCFWITLVFPHRPAIISIVLLLHVIRGELLTLSHDDGIILDMVQLGRVDFLHFVGAALGSVFIFWRLLRAIGNNFDSRRIVQQPSDLLITVSRGSS